MLKEQVNLVNENKGVPAFCPVLGDAVQDTVKHHKHTDRL